MAFIQIAEIEVRPDANEFENIDIYLNDLDIPDHKNQLLYLYQRTYMMDSVLAKVDRTSMFNALEIRTPFLDYRVVDFVNRLPYKFKYRRFNTKFILKKLMTDKLPKAIISRGKKGFGVPMAYWLAQDLKDFCNDVLSREKIQNIGLFNYNYIKQLKQDHFSGEKDNRQKLWTLIVFHLWYDRWHNLKI